MTHVQCQVSFESDRVSFRWSQENRFFEPYHLNDALWEQFVSACVRARGCLKADASPMLDAAQAGSVLFQSILPDSLPIAVEIRDWLLGLEDEISLEIVTNRPGYVPWTVVYDRPAPSAWSDDEQSLSGFWGRRFVLAAGPSVHTLRKIPTLRAPDVLVMIDPNSRAKLESFEQNRLKDFLAAREFAFADSVAALQTEFAETVPEIIYYWGRADSDGLFLGEEHIAWSKLQTLLKPPRRTDEPVLFLNWFAENESDEPLSACMNAWKPRPNLLAGCETKLSASQSFGFGLDVLDVWFEGEATIGEVFRTIRGRDFAVGAAYGLYAPPGARTSWEDGDDDETEYELPEQPYRPLMPYEHTDRPLFAERDKDVMQFCRLLDDERTDAVVLHGELGAGKKSLIRAGVYPLLEDDCAGYRFFFERDEEGEEPETALLAIRATNDLASQLANALAGFCDSGFTFKSPTGRTVELDLPGVLQRCLNAAQSTTAIQDTAVTHGIAQAPPVPGEMESSDDEDTALALWPKLCSDDQFLGFVLRELGDVLPFQLVVLIENVEEVFLDSEKAATLLSLIHASRRGSSKLIVSIRSEFMPRLLEAAPPIELPNWRTFHLQQPSTMELLRTILLPTSREPILHGHEIPFEKYGFQYEEDAPDILLERVREAAQDPNVSLLPTLQIACFFLYFAVKDRDDKVVRKRDLDALGDLSGILEQYVDSAIKQIGFGRSERWVAPLLFQELTTRSDGSIIRRFANYDQMQVETWQGLDAFPIVVEKLSAPEIGMFDKQTHYQDDGEFEALSLGQDVLAQLGAQYQENKKQKKFARSHLLEAMWIIVPTVFLLMAITFVVTRRWYARESGIDPNTVVPKEAYDKLQKNVHGMFQEFELIKDEYKYDLYRAHISQAHRAWQTGDMLQMRKLLLRCLPEPDEPDLRSFEWWYLWHLANSEKHELLGHPGQVTSVKISPDEKWIASASDDGAVKLWDAESGLILADFTGITDPIAAVSFSKDSQWLAAGGESTLQLWKLDKIDANYRKSAAPTKSLAAKKMQLLDLAFVDKTKIVSTSADGKTTYWDIAQEKPAKSAQDHKHPATALAVSSSGNLVATADSSGEIVVRNLAKSETSPFAYPGAVAALAFSPDETKLAIGGTQRQSESSFGSIYLIDLKSTKPATHTIRHTSGVMSVAFSGNDDVLIAGRDNAVLRWNLNTDRTETAIQGHVGWVRSLDVGLKKGFVATSGADRRVKVWAERLSTPTAVEHRRAHPVRTIRFFPDGKYFASAATDETINVFRTSDTTAATSIGGFPNEVGALAVSPAKDEYRIATAYMDESKNNMIAIWEIAKGDKGKLSPKKVHQQKGHAGRTTHMTFAPDGKSLLTCGTDGLAILWNVGDTKARYILKGLAAPIAGLAFSNDGKQIATVTENGRLFIWNAASGTKAPLVRLDASKRPSPLAFIDTGHSSRVTDVAFLPHGMGAVTTSADRTLRVHGWKAVMLEGGGKRFGAFAVDSSKPLRGHTDAVTSVAVHPTKSLVVSGGADGTVRYWDAANRVQRFVFTKSQTPIQTVAFSPDRLTIAAGDANGRIHLWRSAPRTLGVEHK